MALAEELRETLRELDGRGYKAYTDIKGEFDFGDWVLRIDYVQGDPFAAPSRVRVRVRQEQAGFPRELFSCHSREVALRDYVTRAFHSACRHVCQGQRGTGGGGVIGIDVPGQEILERSTVRINARFVEVRFVTGLPAFGRRIAGRQAETMFFEELPEIVRRSLIFANLDRVKLTRHVETVEDADALRGQLRAKGLIAFVADGAVLPRTSGIDPGPLSQGRVVPFVSPDSCRVELEAPNRGPTSGMGIPKGVTLIVGGGYHGKSTLLSALQLGVYNHIPDDGREYVVADPDAVKIRAEDGRRVERVRITPFISNLPFGGLTNAFSTEDASGSTSQAANILEAVEAGARLLLMDEDTSATNFMIRDHRMQELVSKDREPITPFIDKVRQLLDEHDVSTVLVVGGSGDYFDVADHVYCMVEYRPEDVTERARAIAERFAAERRPEGGEGFGPLTERAPLASSFDPSKGRREVKIAERGLKSIVFGTHTIDLSALEQLVDPSQTHAIGDAVWYATRFMDGHTPLSKVVDKVLADVAKRGLDVLIGRPVGDYAMFRRFELAAAINRLRSLKVRQHHRRGESGV